MAYLSVSSPGKLILDIFGKHMDHFLDPATKPRSQGFDPDLFMTELPCHQLGAKIKWVILTFRPGSTYQHQKNKCSCGCGERDLFLSPVPPVLPLILFFRQKTISGKTRPLKRVIFRSCLIIFVQVSQCQFFHPGYPHYLALNWPDLFSFTESRASLP